MNKALPPSLSKITNLAIQNLGQLVRNCRLERRISQQDLADRVNVSRYSIIAIEKGDPKVAIGVVFEAAYILGIPLLGGDVKDLKELTLNLAKINTILPKKAPQQSRDIDNDF